MREGTLPIFGMLAFGIISLLFMLNRQRRLGDAWSTATMKSVFTAGCTIAIGTLFFAKHFAPKAAENSIGLLFIPFIVLIFSFFFSMLLFFIVATIESSSKPIATGSLSEAARAILRGDPHYLIRDPKPAATNWREFAKSLSRH